MARYEVHRTDGNAAELDAEFRARGADVIPLDRPVDRLIGFLGVSAVVEYKMPKGELRDGQKAFLASYRGFAAVCRTAADVEDVLAVMRRMAIGSR